MTPLKKFKNATCEIENENNIVFKCVRNLETLPPELLELIFKYLTYDEISKTIRLVSRQFRNIATSLLNNAFLIAGIKLKMIEKYYSNKILTLTNNKKILNYRKVLNCLELIRAQYQMLTAVTWRYTHPIHHQKFIRLCFFAGSLLDLLFLMLNKLRTDPCVFVSMNDSMCIIKFFMIISKKFMTHFEIVSERKVNKSALVSGCKIIDILDCFIEGRQVENLRICANRGINSGIICMKIKYVIKRTWFTCLKLKNVTTKTSWKDKQRLMYLRLRRLVINSNVYFYEYEHYTKKLELFLPEEPLPSQPLPSTYSRCGESESYYFFYGNMNKSAYENKFKIQSFNFLTDMTYQNDEEIANKKNDLKNCFDLVIVANIRCSPELAPLALKPFLQFNCSDEVIPATEKKLELYIKLNISCPISRYNRLPGNFTWEVQAPK